MISLTHKKLRIEAVGRPREPFGNVLYVICLKVKIPTFQSYLDEKYHKSRKGNKHKKKRNEREREIK